MWRDEINHVMKRLRLSARIMHACIIVRIDDNVKSEIVVRTEVVDPGAGSRGPVSDLRNYLFQFSLRAIYA